MLVKRQVRFLVNLYFIWCLTQRQICVILTFVRTVGQIIS